LARQSHSQGEIVSKFIKSLLTASALALTSFTAVQYAGAQQAMTIILSGKYMTSGSTALVAVMDINCNKRILGPFTLAGNQEVPVTVCGNNAGSANIATRVVSNNGDWHGASLLHDGDAVYP
jgi:hypothetical protein